MVTSKNALAKIKKLIERRYKMLTLGIVGNKVFSRRELTDLEREGLDTTNEDSLLDLAYEHNFLTKDGIPNRAKSVEEMRDTKIMHENDLEGVAHDAAKEHLNETMQHLIEKQKNNIISRIEGLIRDNNNQYKSNALMNLDRPDEVDKLIKESTLDALSSKLRDTTGDANRDWRTVAITEISNTVGMGSTDRIASENKGNDAREVYVYRINPDDAKTCIPCRKFYIDSDGSPKVYKFSTILSNGSNYGKKRDSWKPVTTATHPRCRDSQLIELKPGWKVLPGGRQTYIGLEAWNDYISGKVQA